MKTYASEWEKYANIKFEYTTDKAEVRIGFDYNDNREVTWSYTGTDCKFLYKFQKEETANFAYWDYLNDQEQRADVLRLFGQILGLEFEHRHLEADIQWIKKNGIENAIKYWEGELGDLDWDEIKEYVYDPLLAGDVIQTKDFDEASIMVWPFPKSIAIGTSAIRNANLDLSETDKEFIAEVYPKGAEIYPKESVISYRNDRYPNGSSYAHTPVGFTGLNYTRYDELLISAWTNLGYTMNFRIILIFDLSAYKKTDKIKKAILKLKSKSTIELSREGNPPNYGLSNAFYIEQISSSLNIVNDIPYSGIILDSQDLPLTKNQLLIPHTNSSYLDLDIDVTEMVKDMVYNSCNYGFLMRLSDEKHYNYRCFFNEKYSDPKMRPALDIELF